MELTVATFNIRNGRAFDAGNSWPLRRQACAEAIRSLDADVIGLQEVHRRQLGYLQRQLPDYRFLGRSRDGGRFGEHTPLLVRGLTVDHAMTRWFAVTGARFPRIATTVTIGDLHVTSTHLDESSEARRSASAAQLRSWIGAMAGRHVVLGDFNAERGSSLFATLGLVRADPGRSGTTHHFRGNTDGRQIDHILVSQGIEILDAHVAHPRPGGRLPSDHWPVVARLRLPG